MSNHERKTLVNFLFWMGLFFVGIVLDNATVILICAPFMVVSAYLFQRDSA